MGNNTETTRRIHVACLASYNAGTLHGAWIETEGKDADELQAEVSAMLRESPHPNVWVACPDCDGGGTVPDEFGAGAKCATCHGAGKVPSAEEYAIHDHEGFPRGTVGEYTPLRDIAEIEEAIAATHDEGAFLALLAHESGDLERAKSVMEDGYRGEWSSLADYAENFCQDCGMIPRDCPDLIRNYIDYESMGRDFELGGDIFTIDSPRGCYVFDGTI